MSDDLIRWAPLAIVLIGIGIMVWVAVVMRRQEKETQGQLPVRMNYTGTPTRMSWVDAVDKVGEAGARVLVQCGIIELTDVDHREGYRGWVMEQITKREMDDEKIAYHLARGDVSQEDVRAAKEARPTADAADFGGMPG